MSAFRLIMPAAVCASVAGLFAPTVSAFTFESQGFKFNWSQDVSIGATWRVDDRDEALIGKTNLNDSLCISDIDDNHQNNNMPGQLSGDGCSTTNPASNQAYVDAPGAFSVNGDDGNLNYNKWDTVSASTKLLSELSVSKGGWLGFFRGLAFYDEVNNDFLESHPNDLFQPDRTLRPKVAERSAGYRVELLDAFISGGFELPDSLDNRYVQIKAGDQVLNWGESTFLLLNSLSVTNPVDAPRLRLPGFQIAELFSPLGIVSASVPLTLNTSVEAFYNYEWEPFTVDPPGAFFSTVDLAGATDVRYAMLSFGKAPEDPNRIYDPANNPDDGTGVVSSSSRTLYFGEDIEPPDSGQFGIRLNYFAENLGPGTEFSFYFMNYHSRLPLISVYAAESTCVQDDTTLLAQALIDCGGAGTGDNGRAMLAGEPLPVETVTPVFQYPEDIRAFGISWNTTIFDWAFSGEYVFRPSMPVQIDPVDVIFAGLQPAFPRNNIVALDGAGGGENIVVPGRRAAVPDFIENVERDNAVQPRQLVEGFERVRYGKFDMTFLRTIGGSNFLRASRLLLLFEVGFTHVETPSLGNYQLSGGGIGTHLSGGADGTQAIADAFSAVGPNNFATDQCDDTCRQNPTTGSSAIDGLYDPFSTGYRIIILPTYESVFYSVNLEPLLGIFHDVYGTTPGPGGAHVENRMQILAGIRFNYLNAIAGELRYTGITNVGGTDQFVSFPLSATGNK